MSQIRRRRFLIAAALLLTARSAGAQPARKMRRIGLLYNNPGPNQEALSRGLRELGYIEGQNVLIERRTANGRPERLPQLAVELAALGVDVIVATDPPSTSAAAAATKTIPIVMRSSNDPVESGLVSSLAHPGGNITGVYSLYEEITPKRLELLKEAIPGLTRVAILWNDGYPGAVSVWKQAQAAAKALGLKADSLEIRRPEDLNAAFSAALKAQDGALITLRNPLFVRLRAQLVALANENRIPAIYDEREFFYAGGLMAYGANLDHLTRRAAIYVDKILKGTKPGDLAIEQPTKLELLINLKTAKVLGITIPQSLLVRADEVVQ
jgi:putative ABC transport system substrate-binding protein